MHLQHSYKISLSRVVQNKEKHFVMSILNEWLQINYKFSEYIHP